MVLMASSVTHADHDVDLDGEWSFALDPLYAGETNGWHKPEDGWDGTAAQKLTGWDRVRVPHTWNVDPRFQHDGKAWYRRSFESPALAEGHVARLKFGSVFYQCRVWVNGTLVGSHEGGYTPFEMDVTHALRGGTWNTLAIEVDNRWDSTTLPGARTGSTPNAQLYPWWNWGGINHSVRLAIHRDVFVSNAKIETAVDRVDASATVTCRAIIQNAGKGERRVRTRMIIRDEAGAVLVSAIANEPTNLVAASKADVEVVASLSAAQTRQWTIDSPSLYQVSVELIGPAPSGETTIHAWGTSIGIRTVEIDKHKLLLNGQPIRLAGANRVLDHPTFGGTEPAELIAQDIDLLKRAHLELARLQHYPVSKAFLDEADRKGLLIILEAGNWQLSTSQMADPAMRAKFQQQTREMIEASWNHPSVIGYSVGNEYPSWTPEGVAWTRDMKAFIKSIDDTRFVMFAALASEAGKIAEARGNGTFDRSNFSSEYSDVLGFNFYTSGAGAAKQVDRLHEVWPDRPIFITEYGERADQVKDEQRRIDHFESHRQMLQSRPFVCGLSYWSFNDYRSRYPGSNANGYRPWGLVKADRSPRELYQHMVHALAPATLERTQNVVTVTANAGFPSITLTGYNLVALDTEGEALASLAVPDLEPGAQWRGTFASDAAGAIADIVLRTTRGEEKVRLKSSH
jgi:beta-glucuronidase